MGIINEAFCVLCVRRYAITHMEDNTHMTMSIRVKCTAAVPREAIPRGMSYPGTKGGSDDKIAFSSVGGALATLDSEISDRSSQPYPHTLFVPVRIHNSRCRRKPPINHPQHEHSYACPEDRPIRFRDPRSEQHAFAWGEMKIHCHHSALHTTSSMVVLGEHQQWKEMYHRSKR